MLGQLDEVAMAPDVVEPIEIGAAGTSPRTGRSRTPAAIDGNGRVQNQLAPPPILADHRVAVLVIDVDRACRGRGSAVRRAMTGRVGLPSAKQPRMSVPPGDRGQMDVLGYGPIDPLEAPPAQGRAGRRQGAADSARRWRASGLEAPAWPARLNTWPSAEKVNILVPGRGPTARCRRVETASRRRASACPGGEGRGPAVPHHPIAAVVK